MMDRKCIYCGESFSKGNLVLNPKAQIELPCCSVSCYNSSKTFLDWDMKNRSKVYIALFLCVAVNLLIIGMEWKSPLSYLPMIAIGGIIWRFPFVFKYYSSYVSLGIIKTTKVIRSVGILTAALGIINSIAAF